MKKKHISVNFPKKRDLGKRNWGKEILLSIIPKILSLKLLKMKRGAKGGLQYHHKKNECGYILSGKLLVRYDKGNKRLVKKILKAGDVFHFPPGSVHQEEAITKCEIIEASSPHFNDRVRVEKKYNIISKKGLPSTKKKDVISK
ncbi:cupin domain-containing protein [Pelagibacteraceae bacterium]|jgi:mannose-6-phosphate isomerase|nr:cupin domain-containing protein [Pelagibacteraceae bacterium]